MVALEIFTNGDGCWPDLVEKKEAGLLLDAMGSDAKPLQLALLHAGMASGAPSVAFRVDLPDGHVVLLETSLALFATAARMFMAEYPTLLDEARRDAH